MKARRWRPSRPAGAARDPRQGRGSRTPAEAAAFVASHPEMFAQRTGYLVDQLHVRAAPGIVEALKPTKTLAEVESVLKAP
jgi:hypothetical protein